MKSYTLMQLKQTTTPEQFSHHLREMGELFWWDPGKFFVYHFLSTSQTSAYKRRFQL